MEEYTSDNEIVEKDAIVVSRELQEFLNMQLIYNESTMSTIYNKDIDNVLKRITSRKEFMIEVPCEVINEFMDLIENKLIEGDMKLGLVVIDMSECDFSIKEFLKKRKDYPYNEIKFRIESIDDLKKEDLRFLKRNKEIVYIYSGSEYTYKTLKQAVKSIKKLLKKNESKIKTKEKNVERAREIVDMVYKSFYLYVPYEYRPAKEIVFGNGQVMTMPNFRVVENTSRFLNINLVFTTNTADSLGMKRFCKEILRTDGYQMVQGLSSIDTFLLPEVVIDGENYGIQVSEYGIDIVSTDR